MPPLAKGGRRGPLPQAGICLVLVLAGFCAAPDLAADEGAGRNVVVTDYQGKVQTGALTELGSGQLALGNIEQVRLKTRNLVSLKIKDRTSAIAASDPLVILAGGDLLALRPDAIDEESVTARWVRFPTWPAVKVPLESVRGLLLSRPSDAAAGARVLNQLLEYRDPQDAVIMANGDTLAGEFASLDEKHLVLETPLGKSSVDRSGIRAVIFNPTLTNAETLKGEGALISLVDGSRFHARDLKFGALDRLTLRTLFGVELELPLGSIESLRFLGGCAAYLSDLAPAEFKFEPFLDLAWPMRNDRNVSGGFLTLRGVEYPKGLGVHSRSSATYRLDGRFRWFHAVLGIDDETGGKGSVVFEVLADGKSIYKSDVLTGSNPPVVLDRLDVSGAKMLTLRVDYATLGDIQDHADWCDAALIR
ncbi:MAG: NPCBM/NEW2 domain-containing protein [Deltaproteobacteria bacterium]